MKHKNAMLLVFPFLLLLAFVSCEKVNFNDNSETTPSSSVPSNANLVLKVVAKGAKGEAMSWTTLNFVVYQAGKKVKSVTQEVGIAQFGEVSMALSPGTYQVMVLAHSSASNPSLSDPTDVKFTNADGFSDTFGAYQDITVGETAKTHEVEVERLTAIVRLKTKDVKPEEAKRIRFYYTGGSGAINLLTGYGVDASKQVVEMDLPDSLNGKRLQFELYTFPRKDDARLSLIVSAFTTNGDIIKYPGTDAGTRTIEGIPIKRNQTTERSVYFFTEGSGADDDDSGDEFVDDGDEGDDSGDDDDSDDGGYKDSDVSYSNVVNAKWDE